MRKKIMYLLCYKIPYRALKEVQLMISSKLMLGLGFTQLNWRDPEPSMCFDEIIILLAWVTSTANKIKIPVVAWNPIFG